MEVLVDVSLWEQEFWIRVHGLPSFLMSRRLKDELVDVDCNKKGTCVGVFSHIKVGVDVFKLLRRGMKIHLLASEEGALIGVLL